eukprot:TRINITY_DN85044_c0_g1_i1.p1 TRINITY_DN85044_c0_g1~~TRINITY_DN85044_c0_g1_i1.p1  ORF type:complete len:151 (-),score=19.37 TRINITY_DN85044_c0_g1_i1:62-514(-)
MLRRATGLVLLACGTLEIASADGPLIEEAAAVTTTTSSGTLTTTLGRCVGDEWSSKNGRRCCEYYQKNWCTSDGDYGSGWTDSGTFDDWANAKGVSAVDACCECGGGTNRGCRTLGNCLPVIPCSAGVRISTAAMLPIMLLAFTAPAGCT